MGKPKTPGSVPNKHLYSRLSYLHQAAAFLGSQAGVTHDSKTELPAADQSRIKLARHLLTDLRATSRKGQIRLSPAIKRTACKFCDALLIEGETCTSVVENKSKHGRKPWADVLVIKCHSCHGVKRFPIQEASRQKRRPQREQMSKHVPKPAAKQPNLSDEKADVIMNDS
ncbi:RNAse P Rpr2/Rpp21/SNM1 subunit domain-containing protein [Astrocystis sublimbata]|nr:RNAse P Rpr2/Rpp21/SNM1 subunit domain-containing protein [Astrocystis sublimbata]